MFLLVVALFLEGCVSPQEPVFNETNETVLATSPLPEKPSAPFTGAAVAPDVPLLDKRIRMLEAKGFGLFNYSVLTRDTCKGHYEQMRERLLELEDDIGDAEDNLDEEEQDVFEIEQELGNAQQEGNEHAINKLRDELDHEDDERSEAEDVVEEARELYRKHVIIKKEIKDYCLSLKVSL